MSSIQSILVYLLKGLYVALGSGDSIVISLPVPHIMELVGRHRLQVSQNLRDSPGFSSFVPGLKQLF